MVNALPFFLFFNIDSHKKHEIRFRYIASNGFNQISKRIKSLEKEKAREGGS